MYNSNFLDQLPLPYKFYDRDVQWMYFFIFASCEPIIAIWILFSKSIIRLYQSLSLVQHFGQWIFILDFSSCCLCSNLCGGYMIQK